MTTNRLNLLRWFVSIGALPVPHAGAPIAFALIALMLTGSTSTGAALMLTMTLTQVVAAVPITRLGKNLKPARYVQLLVSIRTLALGAMGILAASGAPIALLFPCAIVAGSVNGAAYGYLRSILNELTPATGLPRCLGVAATLNEVTFVLAPVVASGLGMISPVFAIVILAMLGAMPAIFVPHVPSAHFEGIYETDVSVINPSILLWLACAGAGGAAVAVFEVGAVAFALNNGFEPGLAIIFTLPLCLASVAGGVWVSVRNRAPSRWLVILQLSVTTVAMILAALQISLTVTVIAAVMIGLALAPLGTYYSLILDKLTPPQKRPEVFALLRTANAIGIIVASAVLTVASLPTALIVIAVLMLCMTIVVTGSTMRSFSRLGANT